MQFHHHANGKLLLTGEYFVTEGAVALALPTNVGQQLDVRDASDGSTGLLYWKSFDKDGTCWLSVTFQLSDWKVLEYNGGEKAEKEAHRLQELLRCCRSLNARFLTQETTSLEAETRLEFPLEWGLGSSSTLVSLLARWADVDPFVLLEKTFGGSGYDIAAASAAHPILFQKFNGKNRWDDSRFAPPFYQQLYFVYLNQKRDSRDALVQYMVTPEETRTEPIARISQITHNIASYTQTLEEFERLIAEHERLVQGVLKQPRAKEAFFGDYWGEIKSLGAWGGDFVLATSNRSEEETRQYFESKGFATVLRYDDLVLK